MRLRHRMLYAIAVIGILAMWGFAVMQARVADRPSNDEIAFAKTVSDLMTNELLAALFTEFDETTPENVPHGKQAISLIFNDLNRNMRLIGRFAPLQGGQNNRPAGRFERTAFERALAGQDITAVEEDDGAWFYKRSIALSNKFHAACVLCHPNFTDEFFNNTNNPGQWVGALVLSVPIRSDDQQ